MADLPRMELLKPTEVQDYLVAAKGMFAGAKPLSTVKPLPLYAITLLCGHTCEASLKSLLATSGLTADELSTKPYGHNIINLWCDAAKAGYSLSFPQPHWVSQLHEVYDKPFHLRYPLGFHGMGFPNQEAMLQGTEALLELAMSVVK